MVSIKDVAQAAGVATSTVSKVLNNYPNVSKETRDKVNRAIEELGFVPNAVAAALSSKQSGRVAILMNQISQAQAVDEIDMQYLSGAILKAKELGLDVITIFFSMLEGKSETEIVKYLKSQSITGLIVYGLSKSDAELISVINSREFKVVCVDAPIVNDSSSCVWVDQSRAQYDVAAELMRTDSARHVLYLAGKKQSFVMDGRIDGIKRLAADSDLQLDIKYADFSERKARNIVLKNASRYDCVICASDLMAIGTMHALTELDIFRPVCGFDGITLMGYAGKQMTTVKQDFFNISGEAVCELNRLMNGELEHGREVIMPHEVVRINYLDVIR